MNNAHDQKVDICNQVHRDQPHEGFVVLVSYAVIQPFAVVVECAHSSVAFTSVLCPLLNVSEAYVSDVDKFGVKLSGIYRVVL